MTASSLSEDPATNAVLAHQAIAKTPNTCRFYTLPCDLLLTLLSDWVETADIARLETATAHTAHRATLRDLLRREHFRSSGLVSHERALSAQSFAWLVSRGTRVRALRVSLCVAEQAPPPPLLQLRHYAAWQGGVESLCVDLSPHTTPSHIPHRAPHTTQLSHTSLSECVWAVCRVSLSARRLRSLSLRGLSERDTHELRLTLRSLCEDDLKKDALYGRVVCVSSTGVSSRVSCLSLSLSDCEALSSSTLRWLVTALCEVLCELVVSNVKNMDEEVLRVVSDRCVRLRVLRVERCESVSDSAWSAFAASCQAKRLSVCERVK